MWIPQENKDGYEQGSAMTYAKNLKGRLMLYYGTADNNVHPSNMMQLIEALQDGRQELRRAGRPGPRPQRHQPGPDDGVLHRDPDSSGAASRRPSDGGSAPAPGSSSELRASQFAELKGARVSASIPISERLLNEIVAASLPPSAPVRDLTVQPQQANRLRCERELARPDFLPPISLTLEIEQQPQLPDTPLVLRVLSLPGLCRWRARCCRRASLPPGVRLEASGCSWTCGCCSNSWDTADRAVPGAAARGERRGQAGRRCQCGRRDWMTLQGKGKRENRTGKSERERDNRVFPFRPFKTPARAAPTSPPAAWIRLQFGDTARHIADPLSTSTVSVPSGGGDD